MRIRRLGTYLLLLVVAASACRVPGDDFDRPPALGDAVTAGGTLHVAMTTPAGLDPLDAYEPNAQLLVPLVCETLVNLDPTTGELRAGLAKRVQVSPDGSTVTIELFDDVISHDGQPFDAEDVSGSLTRLAAPTNASRMRSLMSEVAGYDKLAEDLLGEGEQVLLGVQVLTPHSLQINVAGKNGQGLLRTLAHPATAPVSVDWEAADHRLARQHPRCAGPYQPAEPFEPGDDAIVLTRFDDYHGHNATYLGGGALPDRIEVMVVADDQAALNAYLDGDVDVTRVPEDLLDQLGTAADDLVSGDAPRAEFVGLPASSSGPFGQADVRLALSLALDREQINREVYDGARRVADGFYPPALGVYHREGSCAATVPARADRVRAKQLMPADDLAALQDAPIIFAVNDDPVAVALAEEVARQWADTFDLQVDVQPEAWQAYQRTASTGLGFDHPFRVSWSAQAADPIPTTLDPATWVEPLFHSGQTTLANWARWSHRPFDLTYERDARTQATFDGRVDWFQQLEDTLCEQLPILPVVFGRNHWLIRSTRWQPARDNWLDTTGTVVLREMHR